MSIKRAWWAGLVMLALCFTLDGALVVQAETPLQSPNYRFEESVLGGGGLVQSNSANYRGSSSFGESAAGGPNSQSPNYQVQPGNTTTSEPTLSFAITNTAANFGSFSPNGTATATATFSVANYVSYGYAVQIAGDPPKNGNNELDAMATTDDPVPGIEQFGMNLVANTVPSSLGANPDHGQFGFGNAAPNYGTSNKYRYVSGETIAVGPKTSGKTTYTISYVANVAALTPGGQYNSAQTLICVGTF